MPVAIAVGAFAFTKANPLPAIALVAVVFVWANPLFSVMIIG